MSFSVAPSTLCSRHSSCFPFLPSSLLILLLLSAISDPGVTCKITCKCQFQVWLSLKHDFLQKLICIHFLITKTSVISFLKEGSYKSWSAVQALAVWECDPMLINLFLTMFGPPPKPQAHAFPPAFLFYHSFQSWTLAGEGSLPSYSPSLWCKMPSFTTRIFYCPLIDPLIWETNMIPLILFSPLLILVVHYTQNTTKQLSKTCQGCRRPWWNQFHSFFFFHHTHLYPSFILPPRPFILPPFAVCVISWTLHFSFHSSMLLWSSPCECGSESRGLTLDHYMIVNTHLRNCWDLWSRRPGVIPGGDKSLSSILLKLDWH